MNLLDNKSQLLHKYMKQFMERSELKPDDKILRVGRTVPNGRGEIVPVVYQPAVDELRSFLREIHCHVEKKNPDDSVEVEVSLLFNTDSLRAFKTTGTFRRKIKKSVGTTVPNLKSFKIHANKENIKDSFFLFEDVYSGDYGIEEVAFHGDSTLPVPHRSIEFYFLDYDHPVIFVNTFNHSMSERDNNANLWKWEYIPWLESSPVFLGNKSSAEVNEEYQL